MIREGIPLNTVTYNLLMKRLIPFKDSPIFSLYEELKGEGMKKNSSVRPDLETYRILFRACERSASYNRTFLLYQQMKEIFNVIPDTSMYNSLLGYCAAVKDVAQATYFIDEMKENGVEKDSNTYNCFMSVLVDSAPYEETLKMFREMSDNPQTAPTLRTYNTVLKAARVNDDYDRAFQIFEEMKRKGVLPDIVTYNTLLWLCEQRLDYICARGSYSKLRRTEEQKRQGKTALVELVLVLFSDIKSMHLQPNTFSYNKIFCVLYQCEDFRVFTLYDQMCASVKSANAKKEKGEYSGGVEDIFSAVDPQENCSILSNTLYLNKETFLIMIKANLHLGYPERCKPLAQVEMAKSNVHVDREMATVLWEVCEVVKDKEWADAILEELKQRGVLIDVKLYNYYLSVLSAVGDPIVFKYFDEMKVGIHSLGSAPDAETYNVILRACINESSLEKGFGVWENLTNPYASVKPNNESYCLFVHLCEMKKDTDQPLKLLQSLIEQTKVDNGEGGDKLVSEKVLHRVLRLLCHLSDKQLETLFEEVKEHKVAELPLATVETYSIAMKYYLQKGNEDMVQKLFNEIKSSNVLDVNLESYEVMLDMLYGRKDQKGLKRVFESAQVSNVKLNVKMYNKLIETAAAFENEGFAFDIIQDMKLRQIRMGESTMSVLLSSAFGRKILSDALKRNLILQFSATDGE
ncbi:Pentacotripeptide-repeat region of PRORP/Pentatricopeptide repeat domain/PPR repeat family/PPR repeat, putative [Angomonas deanei]|uniref:Pentacotripeptide-repeat region of PRORP/Pentatricopeptide repeat domain/PPR repeat family/PPR repeat, putative n=1 Tax=Angomonas deanei TaxID=59799 RepID=A0A7G2C979_9TRYP|nr:Pentacotripeptide-repeat region of PRORP/Pentatricopeptide repeat domain/PPR repeat family/PPR repeat, putative [Angomonas deanei]